MTASLFGYFAVKHQIYSHLTYNFSKNTVEKGKTSPKLKHGKQHQQAENRSIWALIMSTVYVGARIPVSLHQRLSEHIEKTGASKSEVMASALAAYLGSVQDISLREMVFQLEKRVATLEAERISMVS